MGAKKKRNRDERKKARRKMMKNLQHDPKGGRKAWKKHGQEINQMTEERFIEIMESDIADIPEECNVFLGLKIITKYCPRDGIEGADMT